jgi:ubiquitin-protein ligase
MISKIFHPNISKTGEICVDTLKKGWKREYGIGHVLVVRILDHSRAMDADSPSFADYQMLAYCSESGICAG